MGDYLDISIKDAMHNIADHKYLLPAIQRKFVWDEEQIELLFDSILRDYPINSFMLWHINDKEIKKNYKFYDFIKDYAQRYREDNPDVSTRLLKNDFYAVIDGQQRMTSLYIGLDGTYSTKKANKHWADNEKVMPKKRLYLELSSKLVIGTDNDKIYNFKFLSDDEKKEDIKKNPNHKWFKVGEIIDFEKFSDLTNYITNNKLNENNYSQEVLSDLWNKINNENKISYYVVNSQDQDRVLDIFIRANHGGTPLSFSDLLMSIASANWSKKNARDEMQYIRKQIFTYGNPNFDVTQDFILKSALVLSDLDVKFRIDNFGKSNVNVIEKNWDKIKSSLILTFNLLDKLGFNDSVLRAKNASIPIAYYIYKNNISDEIINSKKHIENRKKISKWLSMTLLKGLFGGQSDTVLSDIREVIKKSNSKEFPIDEIITKFKTNANKNYTFDDDVIDSFVKSEYGTSECALILMLLYPSVVLEHGNNIAEDHMHPKTMFTDKTKFNSLRIPEDKKKVFVDNYNTLLNLQLLESSKNESKGDDSLINWFNENSKTYDELYIDNGVSLDIKEFDKFIKSREKNIKKKIRQIVTFK